MTFFSIDDVFAAMLRDAWSLGTKLLSMRAEIVAAAPSTLALILTRHCEEPTGPARSGRPDDRLRDEAIQLGGSNLIAPTGILSGLLRFACNDGSAIDDIRGHGAAAERGLPIGDIGAHR
jgi:hypothetical protein